MDRSDSFLDDTLLETFDDHVQGSGAALARRTSGAASKSRMPACYEPPVLDRPLLALANDLSRRRKPIAFTLGDAVVALTPTGLGSIEPADAAMPKERVVFRLLFDGRPVAFLMEKGLYQRLLARIGPDLLAAEDDRDMLPLLLESFAEGALEAAEASLQRRIELIAVEPGGSLDPGGLDVRFEIAIDGAKAGLGTLRAARKDVEQLASLFRARPGSTRSLGDFTVDLRFRASAIWLDLATLKALKTGDVLLADEGRSRWERMAATLGEHGLFSIDIEPKGPTVRAPFRRADTLDQEEWMMVDQSRSDDGQEALSDTLKDTPERPAGESQNQDEDKAVQATTDNRSAGSSDIDADPATLPTDATFDDLPVKLLFELGRLELPLGELQEIGPGYVFQLDRPLGEAVEIHAGGRRIGQGEIMKIEDQVGVRVTRLFGQRGA
ncbi:MAG: type III secretion system cytoplasmic ring protein SctQ [Geminicoccaceae bacterium]